MAKRVTIMISEDLDKKVRRKQARLIQEKTTSISYSSVINDVLRGDYKI